MQQKKKNIYIFSLVWKSKKYGKKSTKISSYTPEVLGVSMTNTPNCTPPWSLSRHLSSIKLSIQFTTEIWKTVLPITHENCRVKATRCDYFMTNVECEKDSNSQMTTGTSIKKVCNYSPFPQSFRTNPVHKHSSTSLHPLVTVINSNNHTAALKLPTEHR